MKKTLSKVLVAAAVVSVFGLVGSMDYADQQFDTALTSEIRGLALKAKHTRLTAPPPDACLAMETHRQHCRKW